MPKQRKLSAKTTRSNRNNNVYRQAKSILQANGVVEDISTNSEGAGSDKFLFALGVVVESIDDREFSLKKVSSDNEYLLNPNVLESKDYKEMTSEYDKPDDKFRNPSDPFYELDEARSTIIQQRKSVAQISNGYALSALTDDILKRNLQKPRLKQMRMDK